MRPVSFVIALGAASLSAGQALAAINPSQFCTNGVVDKERLAAVALSQAGVSYLPIVWEQRATAVAGSLPATVRILAHPSFCAQGAEVCSKGDDVKIQAARTYIDDLLADARFAKPAGLTTDAYLRSQNVVISCPALTDTTVAVGAAPVAPKQPDITEATLRVRGSTDGLQFKRSTSQFAGVEKATLSFADDRKDRKQSFATTAILGLAVPIARTGVEAVPYIGYAIDKTTKGDDPTTPADESSQTVSKDTVRAGVLFDYRWVTAGGTHYFLARPEYAGNSVDRSEVFTMNFAYVPVLPWLNDYAITVPSGDGSPLFSIMPRAEARVTYGDFIKAGTRLPADSQDFLRIGGLAGVTVSSDVSWLPVDLTITEAYLHGLRGNPDDLSQFKMVLSANFDAKKYFGVDVTYVRGRAEDLVERSNKWSIGLGAKF